MRRYLVWIVLSFALLPSAAAGHSSWIETKPDHGTTLDVLPPEATVTVSDEPKTADLVLATPDGKVHKLAAQIDGPVITAELPRAGLRGAYVLSYRVVAADGHPVSGSASFTVTSGAEPAPAPTSVPADAEPQQSGDGGAARFSALAMAGGAALVALTAGLIFWLMRR